MHQLDWASLSDMHYEQCVRHAYFADMWGRLRGQRRDLVKLDFVTRWIGMHCLREAQPVTVDLDQIVGSVGRAKDFTRDFCPRDSVNRTRWVALEEAFLKGESLPPVVLFQVGDVYFVHDGHHRVSVARMNQCQWVDAYVTSLASPVWLTVEDFATERWLEKLARAGQEESMIEVTHSRILKQLHEERIEELRRCQLADAQLRADVARLIAWLGERLIAFGHRLKASGSKAVEKAVAEEVLMSNVIIAAQQKNQSL